MKGLKIAFCFLAQRICSASTVNVFSEGELADALVSGNTINLGSDISLTSTVTIHSLTNLAIYGNGYRLDGQNKALCIKVDTFSSVIIVNTTITNCLSNVAGGGVNIDRSSVVLVNCNIRECTTSASGGGIYASASSLSLFNSRVSNNKAQSKSLGIYLTGSSTLILSQSEVAGNSGKSTTVVGSAGAIYIEKSTATISNCFITGNMASGVYVNSGSYLNITETTISDNTATNGGALYVINSPIFIVSSYMANNKANTFGGAIYATRSFISVSGTLFSTNVVGGYGGGVYLNGSDILFHKCIVEGNRALNGNAGGIYLNTSYVSLTSSHVVANSAASNGGAIYAAASFLNITGSIFDSNKYLLELPEGSSMAVGGLYLACSTTARFVDISIIRHAGFGMFNEGGLVDALNFTYLQNGRDNTSSIGGSSSTAVQCSSACKQGEFGECDKIGGTSQCFSNCHCRNCAPGSYSAIEASVSIGDCKYCSAGYFSGIGAVVCIECPVGKYSGNDASSQDDGGLISPIPLGATTCNLCPIGLYGVSSSAIVCQLCPEGSSSRDGADVCTEANQSWFVDPEWISNPDLRFKSIKCPERGLCLGGMLMPAPEENFWVDKRSVTFAGKLYRCQRDTCKGAIVNGALIRPECWEAASYSNSSCDESQCDEGATGPLCGSCLAGFVYDSLAGACSPCLSSLKPWLIFLFIVCFLAAVMCLPLVRRSMALLCATRLAYAVKGTLLAFKNSGVSRVLVSMYGIVSSVSWNVGTTLPNPFRGMASAISVFSFNFLSLSCLLEFPTISKRTGYKTDLEIVMISICPIVLALIIAVSCEIRVSFSNKAHVSDRMQGRRRGRLIRATKSKALLVLGYLVLPPVTQSQFAAFDCTPIHENRYLRADTSVDCDSRMHQRFQVVILFLMVAYLTIPLVWFTVLFRARESLNPAGSHDDFVRFLVSKNQDLQSLSFLYDAYRPKYFFFEVIEVTRRVLLVGALPLLSTRTNRRAAGGMLAALISAIAYREMRPFVSATANIVLYASQFVIFLTYGVALVMSTELGKNVNTFILGFILVLFNTCILGLAFHLGYSKFSEVELADNKYTTNRTNLIDASAAEPAAFSTVGDDVNISGTHCLVFAYATFDECNAAFYTGIEASEKVGGIIFTCNRPDCFNEHDRRAFPSCDAVLCCVVPRRLLFSVEGHESSIRILPYSFLKSLTGESDVRLPARHIVRAFQLQHRRPDDILTIRSEEATKPMAERKRGITVSFPPTVAEFISSMRTIRLECSAKGLLPIFHYTQLPFARSIIDVGFRLPMGKHAGIHFSLNSPSTYGIGLQCYKDDMVADCFSNETPFMVPNAVFVFGAEPSMLCLDTTGRSSNICILANLVSEFAEIKCDESGNKFFSPNNVLAVFFVDPEQPPQYSTNDDYEIAKEAAIDLESIDIFNSAQRLMQQNDAEVRRSIIKSRGHHQKWFPQKPAQYCEVVDSSDKGILLSRPRVLPRLPWTFKQQSREQTDYKVLEDEA